jgi:hypothetical protein
MATGRIGVTPVLGTRWSKAPAGGTTSLSGLDDNSVSLVYSVGYEQVYRNGVLLSRGNDYTATDGTSITLTDATITGDIIEVFAQELVPLTDAISKGQFTAKGSLLSASAASTPAVLAVGTNGQVLKADSSTTTGLAWGSDASGKVLQVLQATTATETSSSSSTYADVGLSISITPSSATSKILVMSNAIVQKSSGSVNNAVYTRIMRDSTQIYEHELNNYTGSALELATNWAASYLDSPATTSATTYKIQFKNQFNDASIKFNFQTGSASIIVMEIGE